MKLSRYPFLISLVAILAAGCAAPEPTQLEINQERYPKAWQAYQHSEKYLQTCQQRAGKLEFWRRELSQYQQAVASIQQGVAVEMNGRPITLEQARAKAEELSFDIMAVTRICNEFKAANATLKAKLESDDAAGIRRARDTLTNLFAKYPL